MHFLATFLPKGKKLPYEIPMLYVCKCVCSVFLPLKIKTVDMYFHEPDMDVMVLLQATSLYFLIFSFQ